MFIGYIYKITGACGKVYIGSTCMIKNRQNLHLSIRNTTSSRLLEKPVEFEIIREDEYKLFPTMNLVEQYYINNAINCINKNRAYIPKKLVNKKEREKKSRKERCKYCKKLLCISSMKRHYESKDCRWAREHPELFRQYYEF